MPSCIADFTLQYTVTAATLLIAAAIHLLEADIYA